MQTNMMQTHLPELIDTEGKHRAAVARLDEVQAAHEHAKVAASAAQRRVSTAQQRLTAEREKLTAAQRSLTTALADGKLLKELQQQVNGHQANITSLEVLLADANREAIEADKAIGKSSQPLNQAQQDVYSTRFLQLTTELAKLIVPAIPICRELETLAPRLGIGLHESGYVLDLQRPQIGRYSVYDDGSLYFYVR